MSMELSYETKYLIMKKIVWAKQCNQIFVAALGTFSNDIQTNKLVMWSSIGIGIGNYH